MPTNILRPLAIGSYNAWNLSAGATKVAAVDTGDPVSHDDLTSYLQEISNVVNTRQSFTLTNKPVPPFVVTNFQLGIRARCATAGTVVFGHWRLDGVDGANNVPSITTSFADYLLNAEKPGGGSLIDTDIANSTLQMVTGRNTATGTNIDCTSMWGLLDWTDNFESVLIHLITSWVGPLVAVGFNEMPKIAAEIWRLSRSGVRLNPIEYEAAWRELREARRPSFLFLGRCA